MNIPLWQSEQWREEGFRLWVASRVQGKFLWTAVLDALYPPRCVWCGKEMGSQRHWNLCRGCRESILGRPETRCLKCAMPSRRRSLSDHEGCRLCRHARFCFSAAAAAGNYSKALKESVILAKRSEHSALSRALGQLAVQSAKSQFADWRPDLVTYVPAYWKKRAKRGYCAAEYMSEVVAARLRSPQRTLLAMRHAIGKQGTLSPDERHQNVLNAFEACAELATAGRKILVVDDVMTTGATANAVAKVLLRAGALEVRICVAARGIGKAG